jgi:hypothetical protein
VRSFRDNVASSPRGWRPKREPLDGLEGLLHARFGATRRQRERHQVHLGVQYFDEILPELQLPLRGAGGSAVAQRLPEKPAPEPGEKAPQPQAVPTVTECRPATASMT